ncbi:MAG: S8 family serine peptidase [Microbacteriaceae bacterium]|nr:S8 family serine peptidase [Microbacteriaceae bacterium]
MKGRSAARRRGRSIAIAMPFAALLAVGAAVTAHADSIRDAEYWLTEYGIRQAWTVTQGQGITIAVIDTGVDATVPDLKGAVLPGADFSGEGDPRGWEPVGAQDSEHGTLVASMAAGRGKGPNEGLIGAAPGAMILPLSITLGDELVDSDTQIAEAVRYAVDHGAQVINMSLTRNTLDWPTSWDDAFSYAAEHDVVVVAAAGNRGSGTTVVGAPATMPGVLTVAGVDHDGVASFDASSQGITVAIAAPSEGLVGAAPGGTYRAWSGTSGAAPIVAGIVALVRAAHPDLDAANVINRIVATAHDRGEAGYDPYYGYGVIDAAAAVSAEVPVVAANPMGSLADWIAVYRPAVVDPAVRPTPVVVVPQPDPLTEPTAGGPFGKVLAPLELLRTAGPGVLAVVAFAFGLAGLAVWAIRRADGARRSR